MAHQFQDEEAMPWLARLINGLGKTYMHINPKALPLDSDYLHEKAMKDTGLTDFGDPYYLEGLHVLLRDLSKNVESSFMGRLKMQDVLLRQLGNRLRFVEYKKRHPDVFERPLANPLVITGIPRSGTTFLHRLLNEDKRWRSLQLYEIIHPVPPEAGQKDRRLAECQNEMRLLGWFAPELDKKHLIRPEMPEECLWLFGITFCSFEYLFEKPVYEYLEWFLQKDRSKSYQEYAQLLQIFQAQSPGRSLLLKAPAHRASLDYLTKVIPNVQLVITERDMLSSLGSFCSLQYTALRSSVLSLDKRKVGSEALSFFQKEKDLQDNFLSKHSGLYCRVAYEQLRHNPLEIARNIYQHYDIPMSPETEEKMRAYAHSQPQHKYGIHRYRAEDFGINAAQLATGTPDRSAEKI